ncbi:hypothetical protein [Streptomyces sp. AB3(2024)]|uniref:hypothetical protein n=1 Tax=Streptomyces sp. AB3(2024) TaxID=3317321 RepID=UPI0035A2E1E0
METEVTIPVSSGGYPGRASAAADCPTGEIRTGGGADVEAGNAHAQRYLLQSSKPIGGERWWAFATNMDTVNPGRLRVYAISARVVKTPTLTTPISS